MGRLPFFQRAWASVVHRALNMFTLIALGVGAAYLYSVVATLAPNLFPAGFRGMDSSVAVYFEAASVITVLVLLGQVLELRARERTGGAIRALLTLAPKTALRLRDIGEDELIPLADVAPRRPPARAPGRRRPGRRHRAGRRERGRRSHGHRRIHARRETSR